MPNPINRQQLLTASCISLVTTSMIFAIRGAITGPLSSEYFLSNEQIGYIYGPSFWGFTIAIFACGFLVDILGMKLMHALSSIGYLVGVVLVLVAPAPMMPEGVTTVDSIWSHTGTIMLFSGFLLMGLAQGVVEGVINPLIATIYSDQKGKMLNILHAWWPAGMVIGGLVAVALGKTDASWQVILGTLIVPATLALYFILKNNYPETERVASNVSFGEMAKEALNPFFLLLFGIMWVTAASELGPDQWFGKIMGDITGWQADGILFLVYTAGLMFVLRFFFGGVVHRFSPFLVLTVCSVLAAVGLYWLSTMDSGTPVAMAFVAATLFGIGKTFYWPTMLGITSERFPRGGALLLNMMGGAGMLSIAVALPIIGKMMDEQDAGAALRSVSALPGVLIIVFAVIGLVFKSKGGYKPKSIEE
ncbi:MFS transporter [Puniceicoccaceae bacterium K14]|nr:MFS transporter [Puniceicoccaceae bacterium K14]